MEKKPIKAGQLYSFDCFNLKDHFGEGTTKAERIEQAAVVFEVIDIDLSMGGPLDIKVNCIKSNNPWYICDSTYYVPSTISESKNYKLLWEPGDRDDRLKYGATCPKCKEHYPHADPAVDFECWSCKNGA